MLEEQEEKDYHPDSDDLVVDWDVPFGLQVDQGHKRWRTEGS